MARFRIEDREYEWDGQYTTEEAMLYYDKANLGMAEVDEALQRWHPYAVVTFIFILKKRAGEAVRWQDLMHLKVNEFAPVVDEPADGTTDTAPLPDGSEGSREASDPTEEDGTIPGSDTTTT